MDRLDSQRYDLSRRHSPAREGNNVSSAGIPATRALKPIPLPNTPQCVALSVPLALSPRPSSKSSLCDSFLEDALILPDALDKDPMIKFTLTLSSEDDSNPRPTLESTTPSPSPKASNFTIRPLFHESNESGIPVSPSLPPNPHPSPTIPSFWKENPPRPLSPLYFSADDSASDCFNSMSPPSTPLIRARLSSALSCPASPSNSHALFSNVSRRLRALTPSPSLSRATSPVPSRPMSPVSRPTSPILQAFNVEYWVPERDPTEGIDVIEIMVTREVSVCVEENN